MSKVFLHHTFASTTVFTDGTRKNLGIFICQFGMPSCEYSFRIFEPRYIELLKNTIDGNDNYFGMCWPTIDGAISTVGVLLEIVSSKQLNDGTSFIRVMGCGRFEVNSWRERSLKDKSVYPQA